MSTSDYCCQPAFKRGKVLLEQRFLSGASNNNKQTETADDMVQPPPAVDDSARTWSSGLTPDQRRVWAKLLQQRHSPVLDLAQLPDEMLFRITGFLDAPSLLRMRCLSKRCQALCSRDEAGWDHLCHSLWETKVHISPAALQLSSSSLSCNNKTEQTASNDDKNTMMMKAYQESVQDARDRQFLAPRELCYDPATRQGTVWSFRFKESAGRDWTLVDPWYNGGLCRKMVFLQDGTVKQYIPGTAELEPPRFGATAQTQPQPGAAQMPPGEDNAVVHQGNGERRNEEQNNGNNHHNNNMLVDPPMTMTWRFLTRPMDLPTRPIGSYVRITVGGRDVPTYSVRRSPTGNWGFVMESCWGLFASFELPARRSCPLPQPTARTSSSTPRRLRRSDEGGVWVNLAGYEQEEDGNNDNNHGSNSDTSEATPVARVAEQVDPMRPLRDDSFMVVTNEIQWREAFLYNVGARILPEGDEATHEFDRAWGGL